MQRFGRLQLHGPAGRQPGAQCNDQSHKQQHPTKTDRKAPPSEREIVVSSINSIYPLVSDSRTL